jgi:hypothetical protein
MTDLRTNQQVVRALRAQGLSRRQALIGGAITRCEAPVLQDGVVLTDFDKVGDKDLTDETWGPSIGGFQVRSLKAERGDGTIRDRLWLATFEHNVEAAATIFKGRAWEPWSTFTSGAYKAYLPDLFPPPEDTHVVVYGDTLSTIAEKYGVTVVYLSVLNGIHDPSKIYIGQQIRYHESDGD